ncbi:hypothetical protein ACIGFK_40335 [Streptomyces sp. NPDC085524]|uniref:hypothetical protein n=1 Tax=Streptomyces sp. NPDC085524 TaxID=3365728 RepID=UPI0037D1EED8
MKLRFRSLAAGLAAGSLVLLGATAPVHAADAEYTTAVNDGEVMLDPGPYDRTDFDVTIKAAAGATKAGAPFTVTFDLTGTAGVADYASAWPGFGCKTTGRIVSCTPLSGGLPKAGESRKVTVSLAGVKGGAPDAQGTVKVSATTPDGTAIAGSSSVVSVRKAPLLRMVKTGPKWDMKVGETQPVTLGLTNSGGTPGGDVLVLLSSMSGLEISDRFSNCEYGRGGSRTTGYEVRALCTFKGPFEPGGWYKISQPMTVKALPASYIEFLKAQLFEDTPANRAVLRGGIQYQKGDGPELVMAAAKPGWGEIGEFENTVYVDNTADFSITGPTELSAPAGGTVAADFVFRSEGPATIYSPWEVFPAGYVHVVTPKGVTVVEGCKAADGGDGPNEPTETTGYVCGLTSSPLPKGYEAKYSFKFKVDSSLPAGAVITAKIHNKTGRDTKPENDVLKTSVKLTVPTPTGSATPSATPTGTATATPAPTATATATATPAAGGSGGGLANTGTVVAGAAGLAVVALGAGIGLRVISRRRTAA